MQFLKTLFWAAFAVVVVLFAHANWFPVGIKLWADLEADVKLPVLVFGAFLLGFLPTLILYRARLWSMRRRLETHERNLVQMQTAPRPEGIPPNEEASASPPLQPETTTP
jgi:lipopolysaccharide assembly protein A